MPKPLPFRTQIAWQAAMNAARRHTRRPEKLPVWNIYPGDEVEMVYGPEKGKRGQVQAVNRKGQRVSVKGVQQRTVMPKKDAVTGVQQPFVVYGTVPLTCVSLIDPFDDKPCEVVRKMVDGQVERVSVRNNTIITKPLISIDYTKRTGLDHTTPTNEAIRVTFQPTLRTFEEDIIATWWTEPFFLQPWSRRLLDEAAAKGLDIFSQHKLEQAKQKEALRRASGRFGGRIY